MIIEYEILCGIYFQKEWTNLISSDNTLEYFGEIIDIESMKSTIDDDDNNDDEVNADHKNFLLVGDILLC